MSTLLDKIKTRSYWEVNITPTEFQEKRIQNIMDLKEIIYKEAVNFRGWDFPHYDFNKEAEVGTNWVGQEFEWNHYLETWRIFQSGQFVHYSGLFYDWKDQSELWPMDANWDKNKWIQTYEIVYRIREIYEFASRLAQKIENTKTIDISITLHNIKNKSLLNPPTAMPFPTLKTCTLDHFPLPVSTITTPELIANNKDLAISSTIEIFRRFNWNANKEVLIQILSKINQ